MSDNDTPREKTVPQARFAPADPALPLGLLGSLAGTWEGTGFNLIARPAFHYKTDLYLQLNHTREVLKFDPIGSPIPNRGFGQKDISLFGLTYLQKIQDAGPDGALHIEPGIWVTQPPTSFPPEEPPAGGQLVARMGSIPHGNAILVQGIAEPFTGTPVLTVPGAQYNFSRFPSFNSTPFGVPPSAPEILINAAGSSEKLTAPNAPGAPLPFPEYDLSIKPGLLGPPVPPAVVKEFRLNTRTPYDTHPPEAAIGPADQALINDPIFLLQTDIENLEKQGYTFKGTVLNIASKKSIEFLTKANSGPGGPGTPFPPAAKTSVSLAHFGGGAENLPFLIGEHETFSGKSDPVENAQTALVYATFWIEEVTHKQTGESFMQLQYAQMVVLNFPIFHLLHPQPATPPTPPAYVNLGWPHITVATLKKTFG